MEIRSESRIRWPRQRVYRTYRDELPNIARYIPVIREIVVRSRAQGETGTTLHNEWSAALDIPSFASRFIMPDQLVWDDFAEWRDAGWQVDWRISPRVFTDAVRCQGTTSFFEDGTGTRIAFEGDVSIDLSHSSGFPKVLAPRIAPHVEKYIVLVVSENFERLNESIQQYLDAESP